MIHIFPPKKRRHSRNIPQFQTFLLVFPDGESATRRMVQLNLVCPPFSKKKKTWLVVRKCCHSLKNFVPLLEIFFPPECSFLKQETSHLQFLVSYPSFFASINPHFRFLSHVGVGGLTREAITRSCLTKYNV